MTIDGKINIVEQAEYLSKHGCFVKRLHEKDSVHFTKYYLFNGSGFAVTYYDDELPVQIQKMSKEDVIKISKCADLEFGGF